MSPMYSRCLSFSAPNVSLANSSRLPDDVGERRPQLVGDVLDERGFQPVGGFQRVVAFLQDPLDAGRVGHVDEGQHGHAFRQRHRRVVDHAAVRPRHAAERLIRMVDVGDGRADGIPGRPVGIERLAVGDDLADMRLCLERIRRQPPDIGEHRVEQPQPAIGAEHRHRLGEMVERLALQLRKRRKPAFQRDLLGDVLVDVAHPAVGIRHGGDADRAAVREMPELLARRRRLVGGQVPSPASRDSSTVRAAYARCGAGRGWRSPPGARRAIRRRDPDRAERGVVKEDAPVPAERCNACGELVEGAGIGVGQLLQLQLAAPRLPTRRRRRRPCRRRSAGRAP